MFYKSCIQSVLTFSFICWFGNVSQKDKNKLQRVVNISSKITGLKQTSVTALYEKQVLRKANKIINDSTHILYNESTWSERPSALVQKVQNNNIQNKQKARFIHPNVSTTPKFKTIITSGVMCVCCIFFFFFFFL